jgi:hypothetical protein
MLDISLFCACITITTGFRKKALCCKVDVPAPTDPSFCPSACAVEPELCENNGLPLDLESGPPEGGAASITKRDITAPVYHMFDKRRKSSFSQRIKALIGRKAQTLRSYFSRGRYFDRGGQAPAQGLFRQAAPVVPLPNPGPGAIDPCMDGRLTFIPMHNQIDLTPQIIDDFRPETEHPIDVRKYPDLRKCLGD